MNVDGLLKLCWLIANEEAKHLGAAEIAPLHFMLGVMKIVDPEFPGPAGQDGRFLGRMGGDVQGRAKHPPLH